MDRDQPDADASLGASSRADQFSNQAAKRIIDKVRQRLGDVGQGATLPVSIVSVAPVAVVEKGPKLALGEVAQVRLNVDPHAARLFFQQGPGEVMVVDNVDALFWVEHRRHDVAGQQRVDGDVVLAQLHGGGLHQADDAPFGRRIAGGVLGAVQALHRRQHDDPAMLARDFFIDAPILGRLHRHDPYVTTVT